MTTLHILNASPVQSTQLNSCLRVLTDDDGIVLCGEAVQGFGNGIHSGVDGVDLPSADDFF